jgi:uncharacterized cofD-like protein
VISHVTPETKTQRAERAPESSLRVVAIGGGTGLSTLLKGLKQYVAGEHKPGAPISELTAVVTVSDDGGSSGRLRKDFNILPPGDIRNCLVALAGDEALLSRLFQYRFTAGEGLEGHSFGNLFVAALTAITGDFAEAVKAASDILATRGHIYPATVSNVQLDAVMDDGSRVRGETNITASKRRIVQLRMVPANVKPLPQTLDAIRSADVITLGPGSLFTSLIPNVLVHGIPQAIAESPALKIFVCNLMSQANESLGLSAADHVKAIYKHAGCKLFDVALVNDAPVSAELLAKYKEEGAAQVVCDTPELEALGLRVVTGDFVDEDGVARHATDRVARKVLRLGAEHQARLRRRQSSPAPPNPSRRANMVG